MLNKFYLTNGKDYWESDPQYRKQILAKLEDGSIVILTDMVKDGWSIDKIPEGFYETNIPPKTVNERKIIKEKCPCCGGEGVKDEIVSHDIDYNSVWETRQCWKCHGTGEIVKSS